MKYLALLMVLAGCGGGASATDVCKRGCTKSISCTGGTTQDITACQTSCNTKPVDVTGCTNGGDILGCLDLCISQQNCNDYGKCVTGCPKCVTSGGDLSVQPTADDGGNQPGADMSQTLCHEVCTKLFACQLTQSVNRCEMGNTCRLLGMPNACLQSCAETTCLQTANACNMVTNCLQTCAQNCP